MIMELGMAADEGPRDSQPLPVAAIHFGWACMPPSVP